MSEQARTRERLWRSIAARSIAAVGEATAPELDFDLVARWRGGERAAGEELCRRHYRTLLGFFATKCRGEAAALATQTLLASVRDPDDGHAAGGEAGSGSFRAHLFALARGELHRHFQRRRPEPLDFAVASVASIEASLAGEHRRTSAPADLGGSSSRDEHCEAGLSGPGSRANSSS